MVTSNDPTLVLSSKRESAHSSKTSESFFFP